KESTGMTFSKWIRWAGVGAAALMIPALAVAKPTARHLGISHSKTPTVRTSTMLAATTSTKTGKKQTPVSRKNATAKRSTHLTRLTSTKKHVSSTKSSKLTAAKKGKSTLTTKKASLKTS